MVLALGLGLVGAGCGPRKAFDGPTVDAFTGRVTHNGQPVSLPEGQAQLALFHEKGQSFNIPLQPDGSFKIGWMPIGKYSAMLNRPPKGAKGAPTRYQVPGGLEIQDGKTDYTVELGKGYKP